MAIIKVVQPFSGTWCSEVHLLHYLPLPGAAVSSKALGRYQFGIVSLPPHATIYGKAVNQFLSRLNMVTVSL